MTLRTTVLATSYATPTSYQVRKAVQLPPALPGIIIFVHGVNSEGEWYELAEKHLIEGLNRRLGREDLKPREWDRRKARPIYGSSSTSPIIHFFWGYRAKDNEARRWRVPLMDRDRESAWAKDYAPRPPLYWGGGAFQNGCNSLPLLWSEQGFRRRVWAAFVPIDVQTLNPEVDRQLQDAPPRSYYAHAAGRLAKLLRKIRGKYPADTITLIGHSQGTQIVLAALALLEAENQPDCVMLMNGPYALESKVTDGLAEGGAAPTDRARRTTFENIVKRFRSGYRPLTNELRKRLRVGVTAAGARWTPTAPGERDNTGRLYIYFNPHDRVMGSTALQSMGWQGLPRDLLNAYPDTLYQRMLARTTPCGADPGEYYLWPRDLDGCRKPFWNKMKQTKGLIPMDLWATPGENQRVYINAEAVPEPITPEEMTDFDTPSDAETEWKLQDSFEYYRDIYERDEWVREERPYDNLPSYRPESQDEMEHRIGAYVPEPTDHSTLPTHPTFLARVVAYDLPIGFCQSHHDLDFWKELDELADWRRRDPYFFEGTLDIPSMPDLIDTETFEDFRRQQERTLAMWSQHPGKATKVA